MLRSVAHAPSFLMATAVLFRGLVKFLAKSFQSGPGINKAVFRRVKDGRLVHVRVQSWKGLMLAFFQERWIL